jgi:hypothetical protein
MFDMKLWESRNGLKTIANLIEKHEPSLKLALEQYIEKNQDVFLYVEKKN